MHCIGISISSTGGGKGRGGGRKVTDLLVSIMVVCPVAT